MLIDELEKPAHRFHCTGMGLDSFRSHLFEKFRVICSGVSKVAPAGEQIGAEVIDVLKRDCLRKMEDGQHLGLWQVAQNHLMLIEPTACIVEACFRLQGNNALIEEALERIFD